MTRTGASTHIFSEIGDVDNCKFDITFVAGLDCIINSLNGRVTNSEFRAAPYPNNKCIKTITANGSIGEGNTFTCPERS